MSVHAEFALTPQGWRKDVRVAFDAGRIESIEIGVEPRADDQRCRMLIPGMPNLHSHAFQRAMAGMAEQRGPAADDFWTWRNEMYRLALAMNPDQVEAVASQLYMEMLEAGFCHVGEFHYLHHDPNGRPYANPAEMASRIVAAAARTGIGLTLLPAFYAHSTFGGAAPTGAQRRFICDIDGFARLFEATQRAAQALQGTIVGVAPHSLRAVTSEELRAVAAMTSDAPIHIHAAEQIKEVEDCIAWSGRRPVEWLIDNANPDSRWCLIHATHMSSHEVRGLAASGAAVALCPITEANLGDGVFPAREFLDAGGTFGIGSDSNIQIGVADELRQLEYSQRLVRRSRNVIAQPGQSTGQALFDEALQGGRALGVKTGLAVGNPASFVSLSTQDAPHVPPDRILDAWIFAKSFHVDCVWASGKQMVAGGRHIHRDRILAHFNHAMAQLHGN